MAILINDSNLSGANLIDHIKITGKLNNIAN